MPFFPATGRWGLSTLRFAIDFQQTHLFDVKDVGPGNKPVLESMSTEPGKHVEDPIQTPVGMRRYSRSVLQRYLNFHSVGMLTCYDIR